MERRSPQQQLTAVDSINLKVKENLRHVGVGRPPAEVDMGATAPEDIRCAPITGGMPLGQRLCGMKLNRGLTACWTTLPSASSVGGMSGAVPPLSDECLVEALSGSARTAMPSCLPDLVVALVTQICPSLKLAASSACDIP